MDLKSLHFYSVLETDQLIFNLEMQGNWYGLNYPIKSTILQQIKNWLVEKLCLLWLDYPIMMLRYYNSTKFPFQSKLIISFLVWILYVRLRDGVGWNTWLLCLTPTLVALELRWVELRWVLTILLISIMLGRIGFCFSWEEY